MNYSAKDKIKILSLETDLAFFNEKLIQVETIRKYSKWEEKPNRRTHFKCWKKNRPFEWRHLDKYIV